MKDLKFHDSRPLLGTQGGVFLVIFQDFLNGSSTDLWTEDIFRREKKFGARKVTPIEKLYQNALSCEGACPRISSLKTDGVNE